jgi:hyperosmotically inducible protein
VLVTFDPDTPPANAQEGIIRMVRHRLVMLPDYSTFDWLAFRVKGNTVELLGDIYSNGLKDKAVNAVEQIDGVDHVIDHMKLLPSSDSDDRIRHEESSAIYGEGSLSQYLWSARPSIHIIVNDGRVWLEGAANNRSDRETAIMRAKTVAGVLQVTDHLAIASN